MDSAGITSTTIPPRQDGGAGGETASPVYVLGLGLPAREGRLAGRTGNMTPAAVSLSCMSHPLLSTAEVLIGGKAQLAFFDAHPARKLLVGADTEALYREIARYRAQGRVQVALCSGDPLFFGLGARLSRRFGPEAVRVLPGVSSLQAAAAFLGLAWEEASSVSLHGRPSLLPLAHALTQAAPDGKPLFILTDDASSPELLAAWMLERGFSAWRMHVLDNLYLTADGTVRAERHTTLLPDQPFAEACPPAGKGVLRSLMLVPGADPAREPAPGGGFDAAIGLADALFSKERNLITKAPVRAAGLAALGIAPRHTVWDLGAGSGAVSIEASRLAWKGQVLAIERKAERLLRIRENRRCFAAANLAVMEASLPDCLEPGPEDKKQALARARGAAQAANLFHPSLPPVLAAPQTLPVPDRIFIGGGLGGNEKTAARLLTLAYAALAPGGRLLAHCVLLESLACARRVLASLGASVSVSSIQAAQSATLAGDCRLEALNPVFLVLAHKPF